MAQITMARQFKLGAAFLLLGALFSTLLPSHAAPASALPGADLFNGPNIVRISITIPDAGMRALRGSHWGGGHPGQPRPEVKATVSDGTRTYKDVALNLKGAAGSFRPVDNRPGMTLKFGKHIKGQTFHGLEKLSLNNSVQDPTYINEKISRELFEQAGIPVPRSDYAVVTLNGRPLGLYALVEGYNKQFLKRYFKNTSGNLYDGGFCQEVTERLNVNSGENPEDQSDLRQLASAAVSARENNRLGDLAKVLDTDRFLTMIALEAVLCHWDGYLMNRNNYRVFSDKETGKMVFMPHGMDQMFGIGGRDAADTAIFPQMNGMVARAFCGTSEGRSRYRMKIAELRTNLFNVAAITNRVREIEARIRPVLAETLGQRGADRHRVYVNALCRNIAFRAGNLDDQLGAPTGEMKFDKRGIARVEGWRPRSPANGGNFQTLEGPDGKPLLFLRGDPGRSAVSWRTRAVLPKGAYRFEGRVRTKAGSDGAQAAANVRISGARQIRLVQAEANWAQCSFDFTVEEPIADIELICELRGAGSAWFDAGSLQLVRLQ